MTPKADAFFTRCVTWAAGLIRLKLTPEKTEALVRFIKFCLVGLLNTAISYVTYAVLTKLGLHYIAASVIAFFVSTTHAYLWNRGFVFGGAGKWWTELLKTYCSYGVTGLLLYNALLYLFTDILHFSPYISPLPVLLVTIPCNFLLNRYWTFRKKKTKEKTDRRRGRLG